MNPEFHLDIAGFSVFLSLSIGLVCCLTSVLLVGLWVFTFSLSLLSSVLLLLVTCAFLLVSFPLIPFPCLDTCLCVWFSWAVVVSLLCLLLTLLFTDVSVLLL